MQANTAAGAGVAAVACAVVVALTSRGVVIPLPAGEAAGAAAGARVAALAEWARRACRGAGVASGPALASVVGGGAGAVGAGGVRIGGRIPSLPGVSPARGGVWSGLTGDMYIGGLGGR